LTQFVAWIKDRRPGAEDSVVLALAQTEQRVVVTCDTDFGYLALRSGLPAHCGVVLIRLDWRDPAADNETIVAALLSRETGSGGAALVEWPR
jgi:predicted nuclease of predicted toxin-antitoxin system